MFRRVVYMSEWVGIISDELIAMLGYASNSRNHEKGICSQLYYNKHYILQAIEGSETAVGELLEKITKDERHTHIVILSDTLQEGTSELPTMSVGKADDNEGVSRCLSLLSKRLTAMQPHLPDMTKPEKISKKGPHTRIIIHISAYDIVEQNHLLSAEIIEAAFNLIWKVSRVVSNKTEFQNLVFDKPSGTRLSISAPIEDTQLSIIFCQHVNFLMYKLLRCPDQADIPQSLSSTVSASEREKLFFVVPVFSISSGIVTQTCANATYFGLSAKIPISSSHVNSRNADQLFFASPEQPILVSKDVYSRSSKIRYKFELINCIDFECYSVTLRNSPRTVPPMSREAWLTVRNKMLEAYPGGIISDSANIGFESKLAMTPNKELLALQETYMSETPDYLKSEKYPVSDPDLRNLFKSLDVERCGYVTKDDFRTYCYAQDTIGLDDIKEKQIEAALSECKLLGPNLISYEEFSLIILKFAQR
eukprot:TRINITY_DN1326_c0_g6_i2.p1 TRINITY_DN1326_c0_g6~~TRINITY_DN1326_c0_g6_i2.p1  ORF type:complete len:492 (+),score=73.12 TRINITY_DN1326_c0_g6_i2:43-1476(+)